VQAPEKSEEAKELADEGGMSHAAPMVSRQVASPEGWSIQMRAISMGDPVDLLDTLSNAILDCGGWILSRSANDSGIVNMLFEFERQACIDIYSTVVAAGLELSQSSHIRFTELCHCTIFQTDEHASEVVGIDLEIQTFSKDLLKTMEEIHAT
jgi:hypothetical protein